MFFVVPLLLSLLILLLFLLCKGVRDGDEISGTESYRAGAYGHDQ